MGALKLFLVLFVFNNYFNHAHSKSVVTDLSDDAEEKSLMEAFSALLSSAESDKIVTRSVEETTFSDAEIKEVVDILLKKHPEAAPYLTTDIVSSKIKETSAPAKYLIKYIFDGLRGIDRKVDEERLKAVIGKVMSETSALATAIKNEFANKAKKQPANANAASTGPVIRLLGDTDQSNSITEDSIARVIAKFRNSRMISNSPLNSPKAAGVIAKQLNGLQPLARTVIKTLIDKFLNKFGIGQSRKSQVGLGISTSGTWRTQSESAPDARELGSDEPAQVNIVTSDTSGAAARSDIGGSGFGNQGASAGQDNVAFSDASDTKIAAQVSTKNNEVNGKISSAGFIKFLKDMQSIFSQLGTGTYFTAMNELISNLIKVAIGKQVNSGQAITGGSRGVLPSELQKSLYEDAQYNDEGAVAVTANPTSSKIQQDNVPYLQQQQKIPVTPNRGKINQQDVSDGSMAGVSTFSKSILENKIIVRSSWDNIVGDPELVKELKRAANIIMIASSSSSPGDNVKRGNHAFDTKASPTKTLIKSNKYPITGAGRINISKLDDISQISQPLMSLGQNILHALEHIIKVMDGNEDPQNAMTDINKIFSELKKIIKD